MWRRAAMDAPGGVGDEPSLTPNRPPLARGALVIIDLDRFSEVVRERGWSEYRPNPATGLLSQLVDALARRWQGLVVYGLDWERGTEEAVLEFPGIEATDLVDDLVGIARELEAQGVRATIVAVTGPVLGRPARTRREAYQGPRRAAKRIMESLKRRGGGVVYVDGEIVWPRQG